MTTHNIATSATTGFNPQLTLTRIELPVSGLPLQEHSTHLESTLRALDGVEAVKVNATANRLEGQYDAGKVDVVRLVGAVKSIGFQVGGTKIKIGIENLRCASCVKFIEDELKSTPGVLNATVNIATQEARVDYLPQKTTLSQLNAAIETWGYQPRPALSDAPVDKQEEAHAREYRKLMNKFWFATAISLPVLATAYYQFVPFLRGLNMDTLRWLWGVTALLTLPVMFWSGSDFFTGGWASFKHRSANMNTLISLGTGAAWLYSTFAILFPSVFPEGTSEPFYDVVAVVIALVVLILAHLNYACGNPFFQVLPGIIGKPTKIHPSSFHVHPLRPPLPCVPFGDLCTAQPETVPFWVLPVSQIWQVLHTAPAVGAGVVTCLGRWRLMAGRLSPFLPASDPRLPDAH